MVGYGKYMGNVDLFHSRRTNYHKCEYWIRDERNQSGTPEELVHYNQSSGSFWAKPVSVKSKQLNVINGVWGNLDSNHIALETDDHIDNICVGAVVRFDNKLWLVDNVQMEIHNKESEFCKNIDYRYTLSLSRG